MNTQKTVELCTKIEQYSVFSTDKIANILASLISDYEGIPYHNQTIWHDTFVEDKEGNSIRIQNYSVAILPIEQTKSHYSDDDLIEQSDIFILQKDKQPTIRFYCSFGCTIYPAIELKRFSYLEEFIEQLIAYKMKHQTYCIPEEVIEEIKQQFLQQRIEQIKLNYTKRELQELEESRKKLEQKKATRQYQLQKLLNTKK